ncbi:MAG TPA: hypothetical protein PLB01_00120 [Thermoanaerobaculia bacterium]|nr:hypothetical protein [Thermoanaerobaculia bacterium]
MELVLTPDHRYILNGRHIPGTTEPLVGLGLLDTRYFTEFARERGRAIHAAIHYHLTGGVDWATVDPRFVKYVEAALRFIDDANFTPHGVEVVKASEHYGFGGTLDTYGIGFGELILPDWKSGFLGEITGLQLAAYELLLGVEARRMAVQLRPDGTYKKTDFTKRQDRPRFLGALDLYRTFIFKEGEERVAA